MGKGLPNLNDLYSETTARSDVDMVYLREYYALQAIGLFVPHTTRDDIGKKASESWWECYERIFQPRNIEVMTDEKEILSNMQSRYERHFKDKTDETDGVAEIDHESSGDDPTELEEKAVVDTLEDSAERSLSKRMFSEIEPPLTILSTGIERGILQFPAGNHRASDNQHPTNLRERLAYVMEQKAESGHADNPILVFNKLLPRQVALNFNTDTDTRVRIMDDVDRAMRTLTRTEPNPKITNIQPNPESLPTIKGHLAHWNLNRLQWYAAALQCIGILHVITQFTALESQEDIVNTGKKLSELILEMSVTIKIQTIINKLNMTAYNDREDIDTSSLNAKLLQQCLTVRMLLIGNAGGGKSHVINCVNDFARAWGAPDVIANMAPRGTCAMNIKGVTFFHGLGLNNNLNRNSKPQKTKKSFKNIANTNAPTKREKKKEDLHSIWEKIGLLIIDEVFLMNGEQIEVVVSTTQANKRTDKVVAGINWLLGGDYLQPTHMEPSFKQTKSNLCKNYVGNTLLHTMVNCAVELEEQQRCKDVVWFQQTSRLGLNQHTEADKATWNNNNRVHIPGYTTVSVKGSFPPLQIPLGARIVTTSNEECLLHNNYLHRREAKQNPIDPNCPGSWRNRGMLLVYADVDVLNELDPTKVSIIIDRVRTLNYRQTSKISMSLILSLNESSTYRTTNNAEVDKGHCNGTSCSFYDIIFKEDKADCVRFLKAPGWGGGIHFVAASDVESILLKHTQEGWKDSYYVDPDSAFLRQMESGSAESDLDVQENDLTLPKGVFPLSMTKARFKYSQQKRSKCFEVIWVIRVIKGYKYNLNLILVRA